MRGRAPAEGPLALDRLIHERLRLGILSALAVNESLSFNDLKKLMQTTDGNLSVHARKLEEASYVDVHEIVRGKGPEDGVLDHRRGTSCARALSRPHGSPHSRDPRAMNAASIISFSIHEAIDRRPVAATTAFTSGSSWMATADGRRRAACRVRRGIAPAFARRARSSKRRRARASGR